MGNYNNKNLIHIRIKNFVEWIAPPADSRDNIKDKSDQVRIKIKSEAEKDSLLVKQMPYSGSFATNTGLRRHMKGDTPTEGQDIDIPIVVKKQKDEALVSLIPRFERYARNCFPSQEISVTKSSVKIQFEANKLSFDVVPMYEGSQPGEQTLIKKDGTEVTTSIEKHKDFIKSRTKKTRDTAGIVTFNDMVRLLKWWRVEQEHRTNRQIEIPSFLLNLLVAKAFDDVGDSTTYPQTLAKWFSYLAHVVDQKETVWFNDFNTEKLNISPPVFWNVQDPVMPENNIVKNWTRYEVGDLSAWLQYASEEMNRAIVADLQGRDGDSLKHLQSVFGKIFSSHC